MKPEWVGKQEPRFSQRVNLYDSYVGEVGVYFSVKAEMEELRCMIQMLSKHQDSRVDE